MRFGKWFIKKKRIRLKPAKLPGVTVKCPVCGVVASWVLPEGCFIVMTRNIIFYCVCGFAYSIAAAFQEETGGLDGYSPDCPTCNE